MPLADLCGWATATHPICCFAALSLNHWNGVVTLIQPYGHCRSDVPLADDAPGKHYSQQPVGHHGHRAHWDNRWHRMCGRQCTTDSKMPSQMSATDPMAFHAGLVCTQRIAIW